MQFQSFTQQIKYNSQEIKILKEAESQQITQQALHPRRLLNAEFHRHRL